jgi:hypothetical protein
MLPYCRDCIFSKLEFWVYGSVPMAFGWEQRQLLRKITFGKKFMRIGWGKKTRDMTFKQFGKSYLVALAGGIAFSVAESLLTDAYW